MALAVIEVEGLGIPEKKVTSIWLVHSGIAWKYQNVELLGDLFNYFDLKTLILSNFLSLAADIIF